MSKKDIIKNIIRYSTSQYLAQFINFFTSILMKRFLGPFNTGVWNILQVVKNYASYTHLGTTYTVFYKFPILKGKGELDEAEKVKDIIFSFVTFTTLLSSLAIVFYTIFWGRHLGKETFYGLLAISVLLFCERIYTYYVVLLRANKDFKVLSRSVVFNAVVDLCLVWLIVSRFKLYGLYAVVILMPVLNTIYIRSQVSFNIKYAFDFKRLIDYIRYGLVLFVNSIMLQLLNSIDKIMIAAMLGVKEVGYYSIALMARSYGFDVFRNFEHVITPYFLEDYGRLGQEKTAPFYIMKTSLVISYSMAILLSMIFIWAPLFVRIILPEFIPGIDAMKIFLIATFFSTISPSASNYLVMIDKRRSLSVILSIALAANACLNYTFIKLGFGINGVAAATAISAFVLFLATLVYAMKHFQKTSEITRFVLKMMFPLFYSAAILLIMDKTLNMPNSIIDVIVKSIIFLLLFSPLLIYLNKSTAILTMLFKLIKERIKGARPSDAKNKI